MIEPTEVVGFDGVMTMAVTTAGVTVSVAALEVMPPNEAVTEPLPADVPTALPLAFRVATELAQVTVPEMLPVVPSE